jgi:hypothetical protein
MFLDTKDTFILISFGKHGYSSIFGQRSYFILKTKIFGYLYEDRSYKANVRAYFWGVIFYIMLIIKVMKNGVTRKEYN